ncbi:UNVERIFIED_CONTAM: EAL domain-containing protein, partial [Salmonella enterica subsp. enterica serovar Weltevreden]
GSRDAAIARALIAMGHQLQLQVLAEGVENEDQLGYLRRNHCDQFQGNLLSGAVAADDVERLLRQRYLRPESFEATRPDRVLLVVDDEEEVHRVTALALADFTVHGRPLRLLDAYTGR